MESIDRINALSGKIGASPQVCKMADADYPYDTRPYARALSENGFPLIYQWAAGQWSDEAEQQAIALLRRAIAHASTPTLGAWCCTVPPSEIATKMLRQLTAEEVATFRRLCRLGSESDAIGALFEQWSHDIDVFNLRLEMSKRTYNRDGVWFTEDNGRERRATDDEIEQAIARWQQQQREGERDARL